MSSLDSSNWAAASDWVSSCFSIARFFCLRASKSAIRSSRSDSAIVALGVSASVSVNSPSPISRVSIAPRSWLSSALSDSAFSEDSRAPASRRLLTLPADSIGSVVMSVSRMSSSANVGGTTWRKSSRETLVPVSERRALTRARVLAALSLSGGSTRTPRSIRSSTASTSSSPARELRALRLITRLIPAPLTVPTGWPSRASRSRGWPTRASAQLMTVDLPSSFFPRSTVTPGATGTVILRIGPMSWMVISFCGVVISGSL